LQFRYVFLLEHFGILLKLMFVPSTLPRPDTSIIVCTVWNVASQLLLTMYRVAQKDDSSIQDGLKTLCHLI